MRRITNVILGVKELGSRWDYSVRTQIVKEGTISNLRVTSECTRFQPIRGAQFSYRRYFKSKQVSCYD